MVGFGLPSAFGVLASSFRFRSINQAPPAPETMVGRPVGLLMGLTRTGTNGAGLALPSINIVGRPVGILMGLTKTGTSGAGLAAPPVSEDDELLLYAF